jgi:hypothetical protein
MLRRENESIIEQIGSAKLLSNWLNGCGAMGGTKGVNSSEDDQIRQQCTAAMKDRFAVHL